MSTTVYRIGWYRGDAILGPPVAVEVKTVGYPYPDADGFEQLADTHFATEREAWHAVLTNIRGVEASSKGEVERCEQKLAAANARFLEDSSRRERAEAAFREWESAQ